MSCLNLRLLGSWCTIHSDHHSRRGRNVVVVSHFAAPLSCFDYVHLSCLPSAVPLSTREIRTSVTCDTQSTCHVLIPMLYSFSAQRPRCRPYRSNLEPDLIYRIPYLIERFDASYLGHFEQDGSQVDHRRQVARTRSTDKGNHVCLQF